MELLTHKDLADLLGVSVTTVKSYRRKFPGCIPVANSGKPIRFKPEARDVSLRIRDFFETGMSVADVRKRLAAEFSWVEAETARLDDDPSGNSAQLEAGSELSQNVSTLAKSMVAMSQQQKSILQRMKGIEAMLEELGLKGKPDAPALKAAHEARARSERENIIEDRLAQLDVVTHGLAETMSNLSERLDRFLGNRARAAAEWRENGGLAAVLPDSAAKQPESQGKVIPLHPEQKQEAQTVEETPPGRGPSEPPRSFLTAPLIVRTGQGQTVSAGGRGRGRFSLNDVKAMLIYGFSHPNSYNLSWEPHGEGWWLTLSQSVPGEGDAPPQQKELHLLLMEVPAQSGGTVVEILQLKDSEKNMHPMEFCAIVDSWNAA